MGKDVAGRGIEVGDSVAFCVAGRAQEMLVGKVERLHTKSVTIQHTYKGVPTRNVRLYSAVCRV